MLCASDGQIRSPDLVSESPERLRCLRCFAVFEQVAQGLKKFIAADLYDGVGLREISDNLPEIIRVWSNHNRLAIERRFENVMPALGNETAADKDYCGLSVGRRQFANGIEQNHLSALRFG